MKISVRPAAPPFRQSFFLSSVRFSFSAET